MQHALPTSDGTVWLASEDGRDHVDVDGSLMRPTDIAVGRAEPAKAGRLLGWRARAGMPEVVRRMVAAEQAMRQGT